MWLSTNYAGELTAHFGTFIIDVANSLADGRVSAPADSPGSTARTAMTAVFHKADFIVREYRFV